MGQGESKNTQYSASASLFSGKEKEDIKKLFSKISHGNSASFSAHNFKVYANPVLSEWLVDRLFHTMIRICQEDGGKPTKSTECTAECFTIAMAHITRGTLTQKAEVVRSMASDNPAVTPQDILQWTREMLKAYAQATCKSPSYSSWNFDVNNEHRLESAAFAVSRDLFYKATDKMRHCNNLPENRNFDITMLEDWMSKSAIALHIFDVVFNAVFPIFHVEDAAAPYMSSLIPSCSGIDWSNTQTLLSQFDVLLLNYHLPIELTKEWRLLFHTEAHGESFATFFKRLRNQGPTVLVIKDKDGHVFGGFASQSWQPNANFIGNSRCFLYSLHPHAEVYLASGLNENYMYLNTMQETLPNGLGMGGQFDYHGLYIDDEFGKGHSCAQPYCTTYDSPQLSSKRHFELDTLEVWAVGPKPTDDDEAQGGQMSILDKDPEAKAMLQIINKGPVSEGLREGDPMAEQPEETSFKPS